MLSSLMDICYFFGAFSLRQRTAVRASADLDFFGRKKKQSAVHWIFSKHIPNCHRGGRHPGENPAEAKTK